MFGLINRLIAIHSSTVFWNRCPDAKMALKDWKQLLLEVAKEPTHVKELVSGKVTYKGTLNTSGEGVGGV